MFPGSDRIIFLLLCRLSMSTIKSICILLVLLRLWRALLYLLVISYKYLISTLSGCTIICRYCTITVVMLSVLVQYCYIYAPCIVIAVAFQSFTLCIHVVNTAPRDFIDTPVTLVTFSTVLLPIVSVTFKVRFP